MIMYLIKRKMRNLHIFVITMRQRSQKNVERGRSILEWFCVGGRGEGACACECSVGKTIIFNPVKS